MGREGSGNEFSGAAGKPHVVEFVRQQDTEQLNDAGEEEICFGSQYVGCFAVGNARIKPEIFVERHVNTAPVF